MKRTFSTAILIAFMLLAVVFKSAAQVVLAPQSGDTVRIIQIIKGNSLREKLLDSVTSLQTIAGAVQLKEASTLFNCDSATINKHSNEMEAFGNVHINQQDSIHTYSQYLKYVGQDRIAYLKKDVRLTDKKGTLFTQELEYDLKTDIATYKNGGKVINGKTTLTSNDGVYYADTKDVFFRNNVHLVDPKYDIKSDSLRYNTQTQVVNFITQTHIKSKDGGDIYTSSGSYDLKNGKAFFGDRTVIIDSTRTYVADQSAMDEKSGIAQLEGNALIKDSVDGYAVIAGQIFVNKNTKTFLATRKPVLIFKGDSNDSTFIAADTLFSGMEKLDSLGTKSAVVTVTLKKTTVVDIVVNGHGQQTDSTKNAQPHALKDSIIAISDSMHHLSAVSLTDTVKKKTFADSLSFRVPSDSSGKKLLTADTLTKYDAKKDSTAKNRSDSSIRFFQAFHHVRIFNDSLQAVCDSLYYSTRDSVFRLYNDPLVFSNKSQISGDTINLFTKNRKADKIYVFDNGMMINSVNEEMYNQIAGRTIKGYFINGALDNMRVKGSPAESIFYPQSEDSSYTGMNRCKGDVIDIFFVNKAVNKVKFINDVEGIFFPIRKIPSDQKKLPKFKWLDEKRPKNKLELFE